MTVVDEPAVGNVCRFCLDPAAAGRLATCEPCDRQRHRLRKQHGVGLTECCDLLPLVLDGKPYCAGCPGDGKVSVVLVAPDGRERTVHVSPQARAGTGEAGRTLEAFAQERGLLIEGLVLRMRSRRAWALARLVDVDMDHFVTVHATCRSCGQKFSRQTTRKGAQNVRTCPPCKLENRKRTNLTAQKRHMERLRPARCPGCGYDRKIVGRGLCEACLKRAVLNGQHGCGAVLERTRAGVFCPSCDPLHARRKEPTVEVTVTDGEAFRVVHLGWRTKLGRGRAGSWIAPLVLVPELKTFRVSVRGCPVVGGIYVASATERSWAVVAAAVAASATTAEAFLAFLRKEGFSDTECTSYRANMRVADLLDDHGLTQRAHAVLAWARAAGVKL